MYLIIFFDSIWYVLVNVIEALNLSIISLTQKRLEAQGIFLHAAMGVSIHTRSK